MRKLKFATIFGVFWSALALSSNDSFIYRVNTFREDFRTEVTGTEAWWPALGKLKNTGCTGSLVAKNLVLTAAHCVVDENTGVIGDILKDSFLVSYRNGTYSAELRIHSYVLGTKIPVKQRNKDWAILVVDELKGVPYIGAMELDDHSLSGERFTLAGYPFDRDKAQIPIKDSGCNLFPNPAEGYYLTNCGSTNGGSGGPVIMKSRDGYYVVGIFVAQFLGADGNPSFGAPYTANNANLVVKASEFIPTLIQMRAKY